MACCAGTVLLGSIQTVPALRAPARHRPSAFGRGKSPRVGMHVLRRPRSRVQAAFMAERTRDSIA